MAQGCLPTRTSTTGNLGGYGVITKQRYGCLNHHRRVSCSNGRTIQRVFIEERVLAGLSERVVSAEAVAEAVRAYHEEMNRQNQAHRAQAEADRKALAKIERAIAGIIAAVEDGLYQPTMKARLAELERQKAEIEARLRAAEPELPDVNPNVAELYRRKVRRLTWSTSRRSRRRPGTGSSPSTSPAPGISPAPPCRP